VYNGNGRQRIKVFAYRHGRKLRGEVRVRNATERIVKMGVDHLANEVDLA
jgi:hypothetical protein